MNYYTHTHTHTHTHTQPNMNMLLYLTYVGKHFTPMRPTLCGEDTDVPSNRYAQYIIAHPTVTA